MLGAGITEANREAGRTLTYNRVGSMGTLFFTKAEGADSLGQ